MYSIFAHCYVWIDCYFDSLKGNKRIKIDIISTDDPTHGDQHLSMFNEYCGLFMYNEAFFQDGERDQIIVPVLQPGNSHSTKVQTTAIKSPAG